MKKWIGAVCSAVASVFTFIFLAIPAFKVKALIGSGSETFSGYKLLTDKNWGELDLTALSWYRFFVWVLIILAVALLVMAVLLTLSNLKVVKLPEVLSTINFWLLVAIVVVSVLALFANIGVRSELIDELSGGIKSVSKELAKYYKMQASLWLVTITNAIAMACGIVLPKVLKK